MILEGQCGQFNPLLLECLKETRSSVVKKKTKKKESVIEMHVEKIKFLYRE